QGQGPRAQETERRRAITRARPTVSSARPVSQEAGLAVSGGGFDTAGQRIYLYLKIFDVKTNARPCRFRADAVAPPMPWPGRLGHGGVQPPVPAAHARRPRSRRRLP